MASPARVRALETDLGLSLTDQGELDLVTAYSNPLLVDCGHAWCEVRRTLYER